MVYTINDTQYVLVKLPVVDDDDGKRKIFEKQIEKYKCLVVDFEIMRGNLTLINFLFGSTKIKISLLVPANHIEEFNKEVFK